MAEFTIEPFEPSNPGPHVRAAIEAVEAAARSDLTVEVGPFGTTVRGPAADVLSIVDVASRTAIQNGASRVSLQISASPLD